MGLATFKDDVYVGKNLFVKDKLSFNNFEAEEGNVTGVLTTRHFNATGVSTIRDARITDIQVSGASTFTGIVTTAGDLYIGGDLYVRDDIKYDEISGRNLSISGLATINQLQVSDTSEFTGLVSFRRCCWYFTNCLQTRSTHW